MRWRLFVHVVRGRRVISQPSGCDRINSEEARVFSLLDTPQFIISEVSIRHGMAGAGDGAPARVRARLSTLTLGHFVRPVWRNAADDNGRRCLAGFHGGPWREPTYGGTLSLGGRD